MAVEKPEGKKVTLRIRTEDEEFFLKNVGPISRRTSIGIPMARGNGGRGGRRHRRRPAPE